MNYVSIGKAIFMFTTLFPDRKMICTLRLKQSIHVSCLPIVTAYNSRSTLDLYINIRENFSIPFYLPYLISYFFWLWVNSSEKVAQKLSILLWKDAVCGIYFIKRRQWGTSYTFRKILEICFSNLLCEHPTCLIWPKG